MDVDTIKVILLLSLPFFLGSIWGIVNAAQKEFATVAIKIRWVLIAAIPFIGFIIYLLFGFRKGRRPDLEISSICCLASEKVAGQPLKLPIDKGLTFIYSNASV